MAETAIALWDFRGDSSDEISLSKGDVCSILQKYPDDWWSVHNDSTGQTGLVPSNHLAVKQKVSIKVTSYLPPGWESTIDADSGERYYYNKLTGQVSYDMQHLGCKGLHKGADSAASGDLTEFKRLREEADAKLAALRQALVYQETLHLIDDAGSNGSQRSKQPTGWPSKHSPRAASHKMLGPDSPRNVNGQAGNGNKASNLRLDQSSLKAIARLVDTKLEDRDDRLLVRVGITFLCPRPFTCTQLSRPFSYPGPTLPLSIKPFCSQGQVKALITHVTHSPESPAERAKGYALHTSKQVLRIKVCYSTICACVKISHTSSPPPINSPWRTFPSLTPRFHC